MIDYTDLRQSAGNQTIFRRDAPTVSKITDRVKLRLTLCASRQQIIVTLTPVGRLGLRHLEVAGGRAGVMVRLGAQAGRGR